MFNKLGIQLYTVRDKMKTAEEIDGSYAHLKALGYTEAHTAGLACVSDVEFAALAKKHGISIIGTHYDYNKIITSPDETMRVHELYGTHNVGIGGMPGEARENYDALMRFIETFNKTASVYAKQGFKLTYHNHSFEFVRIKDNKTLMDYLYEELDPENISFVLDTCWVQHGGGDVRHWMEKLAGRIDILHLKDIKVYKDANGNISHTMTEIGNGNIWWDGVLETAEKIGIKHYIVEQDKDWIENDPFRSAKASAEYLKKYMN